MVMKSLKRIVLLMALPALAIAAPQPTGRRIAVLLVPMDKGAEAVAVKVEGYMNEALKEYNGLSVKTGDDLFGTPSDDEADTSLKRAETGFTESRTAFDARNYEDAERKLRATIKEFGKSAAAMKSCGHLCDAVAMYAASLQARGDVEEAKVATLDLLALAPTFELDRKKYPQEYIALRAQVATSRNAQLRGNVAVKTRPAGARVYVDGEFQGFTPFTLQTLPIGKHIVRLERPGFRIHGAMVEVTPEDQELPVELTATPAYKAYDSLLDKLAAESLKEKGGPTITSVAKTLNLDRGIISQLKEINESGGTELTLALFDLRSGKRLAARRATFQGDEYGQLKNEVTRALNQLMTASEGGGEQVVKAKDPLEGRTGSEDWNSEDRGGNRTTKEKKKKGRPTEGSRRNGRLVACAAPCALPCSVCSSRRLLSRRSTKSLRPTSRAAPP